VAAAKASGLLEMSGLCQESYSMCHPCDLGPHEHRKSTRLATPFASRVLWLTAMIAQLSKLYTCHVPLSSA
jgi:hypothetical protein